MIRWLGKHFAAIMQFLAGLAVGLFAGASIMWWALP